MNIDRETMLQMIADAGNEAMESIKLYSKESHALMAYGAGMVSVILLRNCERALAEGEPETK